MRFGVLGVSFPEQITNLRRSLRGAAAVSVILAAMGLSGCAFETYEARPLEPEKIADAFVARSPENTGLQAYMADHGGRAMPQSAGPWGLGDLTLMALYYHGDLAVARAQWAVQRAAETTAGQYANPSFSFDPEHHGQSTENSSSPWTWGFLFDIPLELPGKRAARRERAAALSEAARLDIAAAAWGVRSRLRSALTVSFEAREGEGLLRREKTVAEENVALLEERYKSGEAGRFETSAARLRLQTIRLELDRAIGRLGTARADLAAALGLAPAALEGMKLDFGALAPMDAAHARRDDLRRSALFNRLDLRKGLALYEASEAALREEIARQYPDVTLSPGSLWDQGDVIWRLGIGVLLPFLNHNEGPIAQAKAHRALEAARFASLQAAVLSSLNRALADYAGSYKALQTAQALLSAQKAHLGRMERQFDKGLTDRLSLDSARLEIISAQKAVLMSTLAAMRAFGRLEDAVERPLDETAFSPETFMPAASQDALQSEMTP